MQLVQYMETFNQIYNEQRLSTRDAWERVEQIHKQQTGRPKFNTIRSFSAAKSRYYKRKYEAMRKAT